MILTLSSLRPQPWVHLAQDIAVLCTYEAGLRASSGLKTKPTTLHLSPQTEAPHSPLFRESGPGPAPAKEQNDPVNILLVPLWRPASETISAMEVPGVITLSPLLLLALHTLRWTQKVISGNQGVLTSGLFTLQNPGVQDFSSLSSGVSKGQ